MACANISTIKNKRITRNDTCNVKRTILRRRKRHRLLLGRFTQSKIGCCYVLKKIDRIDVLRYCLKVRDDEQSVMKSGRVFQARGPATANARSPSVVRRIGAPAGQMKMMTAVDVMK